MTSLQIIACQGRFLNEHFLHTGSCSALTAYPGRLRPRRELALWFWCCETHPILKHIVLQWIKQCRLVEWHRELVHAHIYSNDTQSEIVLLKLLTEHDFCSLRYSMVSLPISCFTHSLKHTLAGTSQNASIYRLTSAQPSTEQRPKFATDSAWDSLQAAAPLTFIGSFGPARLNYYCKINPWYTCTCNWGDDLQSQTTLTPLLTTVESLFKTAWCWLPCYCEYYSSVEWALSSFRSWSAIILRP